VLGRSWVLDKCKLSVVHDIGVRGKVQKVWVREVRKLCKGRKEVTMILWLRRLFWHRLKGLTVDPKLLAFKGVYTGLIIRPGPLLNG
jgi:hypothetical protein